jgi:GxxExxY protein
MTENEITEQIIGCSINVHRKLGPGLLESTYTVCLEHELRKLGFKVEREKPVPITDDLTIACAYRLDLMVENEIIVEIKSVEKLDDIHLSQVITYLRLTNRQVGLLINFNVKILKNGIRRVVNNY